MSVNHQITVSTTTAVALTRAVFGHVLATVREVHADCARHTSHVKNRADRAPITPEHAVTVERKLRIMLRDLDNLDRRLTVAEEAWTAVTVTCTNAGDLTRALELHCAADLERVLDFNDALRPEDVPAMLREARESMLQLEHEIAALADLADLDEILEELGAQ